MKPVDIHLVSWERPKITELAIKTIARNTKWGNYRLVVLDNGSSQEQQNMLFGLHENGLIDELVCWSANYGLEKARDYLLKNCTKGEYFICADNDCLPEPMNETDWIEKLIDLMERYEEYAAISCRTPIMVGSGNIYEDETLDLTDFSHPGGSLRMMRTELVKHVGGWEGKPGRGSEEKYICGKLHELGYKTAFATHIQTLHLWGDKNTDSWGYDKSWTPEKTGHSPEVWDPVFASGDDFAEVEKYAGKELTDDYRNHKG